MFYVVYFQFSVKLFYNSNKIESFIKKEYELQEFYSRFVQDISLKQEGNKKNCINVLSFNNIRVFLFAVFLIE